MSANLLDRTTAPTLQEMRRVAFPKIEELQLNNGIPVYLVPFGKEEIVEIRITARGGKSFETQAGSSGLTAQMLMEGTEALSALDFAKQLDEYGAFMHTESGYEYSSIGLTSLDKHISNTIPLLASALLKPKFPEEAFDLLKKRTLQHLEVEAQKTNYIARREYARALFGNEHPYGSPTSPEILKLVSLEHIRAFHKKAYAPANFNIFISGNFNQEEIISLLNEAFGNPDQVNSGDYIDRDSSRAKTSSGSPKSGLSFHEMPDSMQATIRVGHRSFSRENKDFYPMQVVTTILGGYFGSRLMSNIREEKGYTYGIFAGWIGLRFDGMFIIQTDVGVEYVNATLKEIRFELNRLIEEGTNEDELTLVKNYMLGKIASAWETPSQIVEVVSNSVANNIPFSSLDSRFSEIQAVTSEDIIRLCRKYYQPDQLLEVVCGATVAEKA